MPTPTRFCPPLRRVAHAARLCATLAALGAAHSAQACDASDTATLAACIAGASAGTTVRLLNDITLSGHTGLITTDLTIDGQGFTLDGAGLYRGFFVDSGTVTLQNLQMQNLRAKGGDGGNGTGTLATSPQGGGGGGGMGAGGALFVRSGAAVVLRNVSVLQSAAVGGNGGQPILPADASVLLGSSGAGGGLGGNGGGLHDSGNRVPGTFGGVGYGGGGTFDDGHAPTAFSPRPGFETHAWSGRGGGPNGGASATLGNNAGHGGDHSGGGGAAYDPTDQAGNGGFGGGGGSRGAYGAVGAGDGGFGGGGGATCSDHGGFSGRAGNGGFGGGGGGYCSAGAQPPAAAQGGFGGGQGARFTGPGAGAGGGGGAGMGGAVFIMEGASLSFEGDVRIEGNRVSGGLGGTGAVDGQAFGAGLFMQGSSAVIVFNPAAGDTQVLSDGLADENGSGGTGGSVGIRKTGAGRLVLAGTHHHSGGTRVSAGQLVVDGNVPGNTQVDSGATLSGSGTLGSLSLQGGARLAPGHSIGTLRLAGDLRVAPGAVFEVELDPTQADRVEVAGTATLDGGTVQVLAGAGTYGRHTRYTLISAAGGVSGRFEGAHTNLAFLAPTLIYEGDSVLLLLSTSAALRYAHVARTPNELAVAQHLDAVADAPPSAALQALVNAMDGLSAAQATQALDSLNGSVHSAASQAASALGAVFARGLGERSGFGPLGAERMAPALRAGLQAGPARARPRSGARDALAVAAGASTGPQAWAQAIGSAARLPGDGNGPSSQHSAAGLVLGHDSWISPQWWAGVALGSSRVRWSAHTPDLARGQGSIGSWMGGLYAHHHWGDQQEWRLRLDTAVATHRFQTRREVSVGGASALAQSRHGGTEWSVAAEIEHRQDLGAPDAAGTTGSGWQWRRSASLRHAQLREDAFEETGADSANLAVRARRLRGTVIGVGTAWTLNAGSGRLLDIGLQVAHRLGQVDAPVTASLVGHSADFTAAGTPLRRLSAGMNVSGEWPLSRRASLVGALGADWRGAGQNSTQLRLGVRLKL